MKPFYLAALSVALLSTTPAGAQSVISAKSGLLSYFEGEVKLNDQPVEFSTTHFADVKENSIVSTTDGRAEVLLTPGVTLRLGENSSLRMITNRLVDTRVELLTGSAVVEADMIAKDTNVTVVVGQGSVALPKAGLYRFDAAPADVKVFKGDAEVETGGQTRMVSSAHMLSLAADSASIEKFDTDNTDELDRWSHRRGSYLAAANMSAAKTLVSSGTVPSMWGMMGCSPAWGYNSYYGMMTFLPCMGSMYSPYGYRFYSPYAINQYYWLNPPAIYGGGAGRTGTAPSNSASLARPVNTATYRATSAATGVRNTRGSGPVTAVNGSTGTGMATPAIQSSSVSNSSFGSSAGMSRGGGMGGGGAASGGSRGGGGGRK